MLDPSAVSIDRAASLPGHLMQHDPSSNQPVIDPLVLLWTPMIHRLYMYVWVCVCVCVCVSSTSSFGWAPSSMPRLANLFIPFRMYPKGRVMDRAQSLYLDATISPPPILHLVLLLFIFFYTVRSTYPTPDETSLLSVRFHSHCGASSPGDQIALWFYVDESKSQLLQVVSVLRHARLSSHFERPAHHKRAHFTSIQFETDREKKGVPSEKLQSCFWWKISSCQEAFRSSKETHTHTHKRILTPTTYLHAWPNPHTDTHFYTNEHIHTHSHTIR